MADKSKVKKTVASAIASMKVKVIKKDWGRHKVGTILEMHPSTAKACAENGAVEIVK